MDQNLVRYDLLPETVPLAALAAASAAALALWLFAHFLARRRAARAWTAALASLPFGVAACWLALQTAGRLLYLATPWPIFTGACVAAGSLELAAALYHHERVRVAKAAGWTMVCCRLGAIAIALMALMQPVLVKELHRRVRRRVVVLVDDSASMRFTDRQWSAAERAEMSAALGGEFADCPRAEAVRRLVAAGGDRAPLRRLAGKYDVDVFRFGAGAVRDESLFEGGGRTPGAADDLFASATDVTAALETVLREIPSEELASVLLFTDGRHTGDAGVDSVARKFGAMGVPLNTVVVGGTVPPFDLAVASARAPESVFAGDKVRVAVEVSATMAAGREVEVRLFLDDDRSAPVDVRRVAVQGDRWRGEVHFAHEPAHSGVFRYHVEVAPAEGELLAGNNSWDLDVSVSDDRTNVLLVDRRPRWEYRYLRNLFYGRDKSVHLQDYLVRPDRVEGDDSPRPPAASASRPFGESESGAFPESPEEWRKFDVVILGDLSDAELTPEVVGNVRRCVEERGALLVLIAGPEAMPYAVRDERMRELIPVEYEPDGRSRREPPEEGFAFALTPAGRAHPIMRQSSSESENDEIWNSLPPFAWRVPVDGVKPGAEVLAFARVESAATAAETVAADPESAIRRLERLRDAERRNALAVVRPFGRGRVLMMNTDMMWRLRYRVGDVRHHLFWGQVMRWGAGERLRAGDEFVRLGTDQLRYGADEDIAVYARFLDRERNGVEGLAPRAVLEDRDGRTVAAAALALRPGSNGFYEGRVPATGAPGEYRVRLECPESAGLAEGFPEGLAAGVAVVTAKQPAEFTEVTASREVPERMAVASGGRAMGPAEFVKLDDGFGAGSRDLVDRVEYPLWSTPPLFVLMVLLLAAEWIVRKRANLA